MAFVGKSKELETVGCTKGDFSITVELYLLENGIPVVTLHAYNPLDGLWYSDTVMAGNIPLETTRKPCWEDDILMDYYFPAGFEVLSNAMEQLSTELEEI